MAARTKRKRTYGTDVFRKIGPPECSVPFEVSYWDLWFVVIREWKFGGDWAQMASHFREMRSPLTSYRSERMLNHQVHLQQRMSEAGLSVEGLVGDVALLKKEKPRAKRKVLDQTPDRSEMSYWMQHTPREQREVQAMRGYWSHFPVSPAEYEDRVQRLFKKTVYSHSQAEALERKIERFLKKSTKKAPVEHEVALYRTVMTVLLERMEQIPLAPIGMFYDKLFEHYTALPRHELNMPPKYFWQDLIAFLIWEDYGLTDNHQPDLLKNLPASELPLVEAVLRREIDDLSAHDITYQAENALTMLGSLCTLHKKFDKFVPLAKEMGTREWKRITNMSEMAENNQRPELALAVYQAALGPGSHEQYLRKKYEKLKKRVG